MNFEKEKGNERTESIRERQERHLEDLRSLAETLDLKIIREENKRGTQSIVVDDGRGKEVNIGFPDGTHFSDGGAHSPQVTDYMYNLPEGVNIEFIGSGGWEYIIEI